MPSEHCMGKGIALVKEAVEMVREGEWEREREREWESGRESV